jgi:quercetin 2,3-dioxygenase
MKKSIYKSATRGQADYGWLKPHYSFSFANYYNPERVHFGMLRVVNDDWIGPGGGFDTHPHDNMEIVTIPLTGALEHRDSMGSGSVIRHGEIQVMSAGTGITHSEFNHSKTDPLTLLQIWIFPKVKNVKPRYDQREFNFDTEKMKNRLNLVISPNQDGDTLWLHQDTWFSVGKFDKDKEFTYILNDPANGLFIFLIEGKISFDGSILEKRDTAEIIETGSVAFKTTESSTVLLIEVPMK